MRKFFLLLVFLYAIFYSSNSIAQYGIIYDVAGDGNPGYGIDGWGDGCHADSAWLNYPQGVWVDKNQNIYFTDGTHYVIRKVNATTGIISVIAGNDTNGYSGDGGLATNAKIGYCLGLCLDTAGNIYFADAGNNRIRMISSSTGYVSTVVGNGTSGFSGDGGLATSANINYPKSLHLDTAGNIYFVDAGSYRIRKVSKSTGTINSIAGNGFHGFSGDGILATSATLNYPLGIITDRYGNIYFTDNGNNRVRQINTSGIISTIAGNGSVGYTGDGGPGTAASLNYPQSIGVDTIGNVYFTDQNGNVIRKVDVATGIITTVAGTTVNPGASGDWWTTGKTSDSTNLYSNFICVDQTGNIYFSTSSAVRKIIGSRSAIATIYVTDSQVTAPCSLPQTLAIGIHGTIVDTPASSDSMRITIDYGEFSGNSIKNYTIPYWLTSVYGFGDTFNRLCNYIYRIPGIYNPIITFHTLGGFADVATIPSLIVGHICDSSITSISIDSVKDTLLSGPCILPANVLFNVWGTILGTPSTGDSVYLAYKYNDYDTVFNLHVVPIILSGSNYYFLDSFHNNFAAGNYNPQVMAVISSGRHNAFTYFSGFSISNCISGSVTTFLHDTATITTICPMPYTDQYWISGSAYGLAALNDSVRIHLDFGGGSDTVFKIPIVANGHGSFNYETPHFLHVFTKAGTYKVKDTAFCGLYDSTDLANALVLGGSPIMDMHVAGWGWGFVPGDTGWVGVWSGNLSGYICDTLSSTVKLTLDPHLVYAGMKDGPSPGSISGSTLTWSFSSSISPLKFYATVKVLCSSTAASTDSLCNQIQVIPITVPDTNTADNTYRWCEKVRSSWSTNEKLVSPIGDGPPGFIPDGGTPLNYLVHFQNTGTFPSKNVTIIDTFDYFLDLSTLRVLNSSFPVSVTRTSSNVVVFKFTNINLPTSTDSPLSSMGYLAFDVIPIRHLYVGAEIKNYVSIYLDSTTVSTDTTLNTIGTYHPISLTKINSNIKIQVYPNPAHDKITVVSTDKIMNVSLLDLVGHIVYSHSFNTMNAQVDLKQLPSGIYFIKVNDFIIEKLVKE